MIQALRTFSRLIVIIRTLARHDALFLVSHLPMVAGLAAFMRVMGGKQAQGRPGQRLAKAFAELGPTFIKLGQALSTRPDIVGENVAADLTQLQDALPPFSTAQARAIVESELGKPLNELFLEFDDQPVAAASIAQVHFAVTTEGENVAVKILRPGVERRFAEDLEMMAWLARLIEERRPEWRRLKPVEAVATFAESVAFEMDLRFEAAASAEMRDNFRDDPTFLIPKVDWTRTGERVLTLERVSGIPIDEREDLIAAGHDVDAVLEKAAAAFFNMVFRDGFFHADMHPGNLFVNDEGNIVAVDFGITGRVDDKTRRYLGEMLLGFLNGDFRRVAEVHFEAGYVPAWQSVDLFTQACRSIAEPILGKPLNEISLARLLGQLFQVTKTFSMETQPQLLLLQKSMFVAEGVGRRLNPNVNMWMLARPLIEEWIYRSLHPLTRVKANLGDILQTVEDLPSLIREMRKTMKSLSEGVSLHPDCVAALRGKSADGRQKRSFISYMGWISTLALSAYILLK